MKSKGRQIRAILLSVNVLHQRRVSLAPHRVACNVHATYG